MNELLDFRAWDGEKMHYSSESSLKVFFDLFDNDYDKSIRMQFTGLFDVDKRKIYAGDYISVIVPGDTKITGVVVWYFNNGCWAIRWRDDDVPFMDKNQTLGWRHMKIWGNIYENPELLKGNRNEFTESKDTPRYDRG